MRGDRKEEVWRIFAPHHYLNHDLNPAADCWVLKWGETLVGFCAVLPQPTGTANYCRRIHRLVILPDFQGLGVGTRFLDAICDLYLRRGYKVYIRSAHAKLANYWAKTPTWISTARNGRKGDVSNGEINNDRQNPYIVNRPRYSYEYVGIEYSTKPHKEIVVDGIENIDMDAMRKYLYALKQMNYVTVVHNRVKSESMLNVICKDMGIRTELLYIRGKVSKKHIGERKIVAMKSDGKPIFRKVS